MVPRMVVLAVVTSLAASCGEPGAFRVGVVVDGAAAQAAELAAAAVNAEGGIRGRPLELTFLSAHSPADPEAAIIIADSLARDRSILAVVGHSNSAASLAASKIYNDAGLPQVAPTTTAPAYSPAGPYSFRLVSSDSVHAMVLAAHARATVRTRAAIAYVNDEYGRGIHELIQPMLGPRIDVVLDVAYLDGSDPARVARIGRAVAESGADILFWLGRPTALREVLRAARDRGADLLVLGGDPLDSPVVHLDYASFAGVRFVQLADLTSPTPATDSLRVRLERLGSPLTSEAVLAFDAVRLIAEIGREGADTRAAIRDALAAVGRTREPYMGLGGAIEFDEAGDARREVGLVEVTADGVRRLPSGPGS